MIELSTPTHSYQIKKTNPYNIIFVYLIPGYKADHPSGVRYSLAQSCSICPAGYYGNDTDRADCYICPAGYYCPEGTHHGTDNPCPIGAYCPEGSPWYLPCPTV